MRGGGLRKIRGNHGGTVPQRGAASAFSHESERFCSSGAGPERGGLRVFFHSRRGDPRRGGRGSGRAAPRSLRHLRPSPRGSGMRRASDGPAGSPDRRAAEDNWFFVRPSEGCQRPRVERTVREGSAARIHAPPTSTTPAREGFEPMAGRARKTFGVGRSAAAAPRGR
ncbi:hypothetical protein HMPREF9440_02437 [Sutterella parvirubra YIT 11816]|uniref:Uncharacterized protein n=1 Tax=Sutterella parvirubra YIT 11816 TaxID=762967 RepID=H3KI35_9BURK|nr:hypothetical protein HMPREF9440_02437 [Sutterella parvirubra YIT 11816]